MCTTITQQKKEYFIDERRSHVGIYEYLWEFQNFTVNVLEVQEGKEYGSPLTITLDGSNNISTDWTCEFYPYGYKNEISSLCFVIWREDCDKNQDDLDIKLCIINQDMQKTWTVNCVEKKEVYVDSNMIRYQYTATPMAFSSIHKPVNKILTNDTLRVLIRCEISVKLTTKFTKLHGFYSSRSEFREGIANSFHDDKFSDVLLEVKGVEFRAHKMLLAIQSPVFSRMFEQNRMIDCTNNHVIIDDIEPDVAHQLLEYVYTDEEPSKIEYFPHQLLAAAHKYQMKRLINMCEAILIKKISLENAIGTFILADTCGTKILRKTVVEFILTHRILLEQEEFRDLECNHAPLAFEIYHQVILIKSEEK